MSEELKCPKCEHELDLHTDFGGCQYYQCECSFSQDDIYRSEINALQATVNKLTANLQLAKEMCKEASKLLEALRMDIGIGNILPSPIKDLYKSVEERLQKLERSEG